MAPRWSRRRWSSAGKATCTLPTLAKGTHSISAVYGGDTSYAAKASAAVSLTVS